MGNRHHNVNLVEDYLIFALFPIDHSLDTCLQVEFVASLLLLSDDRTNIQRYLDILLWSRFCSWIEATLRSY